MKPLNLYYATVTNNDDSQSSDGEQKSRIQVQILPEFKDVEIDLLPWVKPFISTGMSATNFSHTPPEIDSKVWVIFIDNHFKDGYYFTGAFIKGFFDYAKWEDAYSLIQNSDIAEPTYPNPRFYLLEDGAILFNNTENGEKGIINSNGTYIVIDTDGNITNYTKDKDFKIYNDSGNVTLNADGSVLINDGGKAAAREGDEVLSDTTTDSSFWTMWTAFFTVITGAPIPEPGNGSPSAFQTALSAAISGAGGAPSSLTSKINEGSGTVEIGD